MPAVDLAVAIRERRLSAREVIEAHIGVLDRWQARTNAVATSRYDEARAAADAADNLVASGVDSLPPLLGVPCTVKEMIGVAGMPHTAGFHGRRGRTASSTATAAQRLINAA